MATVRDLVRASLRKIGVLAAGEDPDYDDANDALRDLNSLINQWAAEPLQLYTVTRTPFDLQANLAEYLIGNEPDGSEASTSDGFDSLWAGVPPGWTASGSGTITNDTVDFQAGGHAVKLDGTVSAVSIYRDFVVRASAEPTISIYSHAGFTSTGFVYVQNLATDHYLKADGTWVVSQEEVFESNAGAPFVLESITFGMEDAETIGNTIATLRVTLNCTSTGFAAWFDTFGFDAVGAIPIPRPVRADEMTVNLIDTSVTPALEIRLTPLTEDAWAAITSKDLTSTWPTAWYYNPTFPYGTLTFWPVPTASTIQGVIYVKTQLSEFGSLDDEVSLPPAYERMIVTNLALELAPSYPNSPISPLLVKQAQESLAAVKRTNRRLSDLSFPAGALVGSNYGRWGYNIRTG